MQDELLHIFFTFDLQHFIKLMHFIYGSYSFPIKSYSPADLKVESRESGTHSIQIRQRCLHLFFIPVLALDKVYTLRKNGKNYTLPDEYLKALKKKSTPRTPLYAFSLPIIVLLIVAYLGFENKINDILSGEGEKSVVSELETNFSNLNEHDYLKLVKSKNFDLDVSDHTYFLKITSATDQEIKYVSTSVPVVSYEVKPFMITRAFQQSKSQPITLSRKEFEKGIPFGKRLEKIPRMRSFGVNFLGNESLYLIKETIHINGPFINMIQAGMNKNYDVLIIDLENLNAEATLSEIETIKGDSSWSITQAVPIALNEDGKTKLRIRNTGYILATGCEAIFKFEDKDGIQANYLFKGNDLQFSLERILQ